MAITHFLVVERPRLLGRRGPPRVEDATPLNAHQQEDQGELVKLKRDGTPPPRAVSLAFRAASYRPPCRR
jgi:hypothetical protein